MDPNITKAERRKQVRLRRRPDLIHSPQRYEGKLCQVIKDPVSLKYYRFNDMEYFVFSLLDGKNTLEDIQKSFERRFAPERLELEDLEGFARQLVTSGLVHHESPNSAEILFEKRVKQRRMKRFAALSNILYIKIPVFDPDRILTAMIGWIQWVFTRWFLFLSILLMVSAAALVTMKFPVFWSKLPAYQEFFRFRTLLYLWLAMGVVKIIHEFGHGLSCKAFGGECHEMGALLMCFSPALYCNVTDSWTLADKWKRIIISFAGIYVELIIAAISTFVWWYTPHWPFVNNVALCLMVLCSISTFLFNANPLMKFDGYYILADLIEVPNLRERSNRYLSHRFQETCLGIEVQPEPYMAVWRRRLFIFYAILSFLYRWFLVVGILYFLMNWLKPYKLEIISFLLALGALGSMVFWPIFRVFRNVRERGRFPDMKRKRVYITLVVLLGLVLFFFFVPLPINRVLETGLVQIQDTEIVHVYVNEPGGFLVTQYARDGEMVSAGQDLAAFHSPQQENKVAQLREQVDLLQERKLAIESRIQQAGSDRIAIDRYKVELAHIEGKLRGTTRQWEQESRMLEELRMLRAPRGGLVMGAPQRDQQYRYWEKTESGRFCSIGDPKKLWILVPVGPTSYREMKENLEARRKDDPSQPPELLASILLSNRSDKIYHGKVTALPDSHETNVPVGLTSKGGGPLATKPSSNPNVNEPLAQTYLVRVEITDPDLTIVPGTLVTVKVHLRWRSAAWWIGQKIASALDWGIW